MQQPGDFHADKLHQNSGEQRQLRGVPYTHNPAGVHGLGCVIIARNEAYSTDDDSSSTGSDDEPLVEIQGSEHEQGHSAPSMKLQNHHDLPANPSKYCKETEVSSGCEDEQQSQKVLDPSETLDEECQTLRCQSPSRKPRRRRPVSLDLNGQGAEASALSPCFFGGGGSLRMNKSSMSSSGTFPSPGIPNYQHKEWNSERVPAYNRRRYRSSGGGLVPINSGRALPSKWEDAEKWIFSPVSGDGVGRQSVPYSHVRRPKSKSGPLGPLSVNTKACSAASPPVSGKVGKFTTYSPFLAGVLIPENECFANGDSERAENIERSASIQEWSETLVDSSSSLPSSRDEKFEENRGDSTITSPLVLRDASTQMSPERNNSSRNEGSSAYTSLEPTGEQLESQSSKSQVRDVQVDDRVTVTRWSKKHIARSFDKSSAKIVEWKKKTVESEGCLWELTEAKSMSKSVREEAKITAWENLQKAKAEAEIRKLEMKLEKKRASTMDKIINKLVLSQKKAQEMRDAVNSKQAKEFSNTKKKSYSYRTGQMSGCFACPAF